MKNIALVKMLMLLLIIISSSLVNAGSKTRGAAWILSAFISGAISGAVSAEMADRYKIRRSMIRNERLINHSTVKGLARDGSLVSVPSGNYSILLDDINSHGKHFIVIENKNIDDLTALFILDEV